MSVWSTFLTTISKLKNLAESSRSTRGCSPEESTIEAEFFHKIGSLEAMKRSTKRSSWFLEGML
eukprot:gene9938-18547_t